MIGYELMIRHYRFLVLISDTVIVVGVDMAVKVIPLGKSTGSAGSNLCVEIGDIRNTMSVAPVLSVTVIVSEVPALELATTMPATFRLPVKGVKGLVSTLASNP